MNDDEESRHPFLITGYTDEEWYDIMLKITKREITLCKTCDIFFEYSPQKLFCDECSVKRRSGRRKQPENKEKVREYNQRPEVKELKREYDREYRRRPEVKKRRRECRQRPEVKEKHNEYLREYRRRKKAEREEE